MSEKNILTGTLLGVSAASKEEVFEAVARWLIEHGAADDFESVMQAFRQREEIGGTLNYPGVALPNAVGAAIKKDALILLQTDKEIPWQKEGDAHTFICMCISENPVRENLAYIQAIVRRTVNAKWEAVLLGNNHTELASFLEI